MDYINLTPEQGKHIDELLAKNITELTEEELTEVTEYKAAWIAYEKYLSDLKSERKKTADVISAYHKVLNEDCQEKFDAKINAIMGNDFVLEDD